jgi:NADH:ubiquinone oxidoreductase subunit E
MTLLRKEIKICLGSSCFSRGNKRTLQEIQKYLKDHNLEREVILKGNHCFSNCNKGPVIQFGESVYEQVTSETVLEILEKELGEM